MYNNTTEQKIRDIPSIKDINTNRLPQELTKIYAQIVSLRRQVLDGTINFQDDDLVSGLTLLRKLANNLETILLTIPNHEQKESIAFVAGTANQLIHKMHLIDELSVNHLEMDSISSYIASIVLFLIGNSQADAAESALSLEDSVYENLTKQRLISSIISLATGKLSEINTTIFHEEEINHTDDINEIALNYLWRELGIGIVNIAQRLVGNFKGESENNFDKVIELSISEPGLFNHKSILTGPYRLARLLKILEGDILNRAVINIPPPMDVDSTLWDSFLKKLANDRPYLWENHKDAVNTNFLNHGISAILTLPTGSGKSTLSELKIASCLYYGKKVIYLVPTHALENQVKKNLKRLFTEFEPINIEFGGEYTDFEIDGSFPIEVMTPERCLTFQNLNPEYLASVGLIVFDEFHLIHGTDIKKDRRSIDAMYCLLSLFNSIPNADFLLISAMVENGEEIASWVSQITNRECKLFNSTWKPTRQLHGCIVFDESKIIELTENINVKRKYSKTTTPSAGLKKELLIDPQCFFSLKNIWETNENQDYFRSLILSHKILLSINGKWRLTSNRNNMAANLAIHFSELGLKTLVFVDDPRVANSTTLTIEKALRGKHNKYEEYISFNKNQIQNLSLELGSIENSYFHNCPNVGMHHGLLLQTERDLIEGYFKYSDGLGVLVATATLAQGINLPAEIVIIAGDDRYSEDEEKRQRVNPHELLNAAGRAGRAGLSSQGAVILIPGEIITIKDSAISSRWWDLKNEVFSKGDQCLSIEDSLGYFLDSLQERLQDLSIEQTNILYRFKPENSTNNETKNLLNKSFYAFKAASEGRTNQFDFQVRRLIERRNELDNQFKENQWQKEISLKTSLEPIVINELSVAIDNEGIENFQNKTIVEIIDWFFNWLSSNDLFINKIFTKQSTIEQIKKAIGLSPKAGISEIIPRLNILANILRLYVQGVPLNKLNEQIPDVKWADNSNYLIKARNFVNRLMPELSFGFGLISLIFIEKAKQNGIESKDVNRDIRILASCIREGFDSSRKLFFKKNHNLTMRVETHIKFKS